MENITKTVCDNINLLRKRANMTQEELSKLTGLSQSAVSRIHKGEQKRIKLKHLYAICGVFNVTHEEMLEPMN